MIIKTFDNQEVWLDARKRRITGSRLYDVVTLRGNGKKKGYYELIAERMAMPGTSEDSMARGHRLEPEALVLFSEIIKKPINNDLVMWQREDNEFIAISPDGVISKTEAVEVKCLQSSTHIEIFLTQKLPTEYQFQVYQYFIVNDDLKKLYVVLYNPCLIAKQLFWIEFKREDIQEKIDEYLEYQVKTIKEVEDIVEELTF